MRSPRGLGRGLGCGFGAGLAAFAGCDLSGCAFSLFGFCCCSSCWAITLAASASEQLINMAITFFIFLFRRFSFVIYSNSLRVTERLLVSGLGHPLTRFVRPIPFGSLEKKLIRLVRSGLAQL